jgi:hypothetical protein
MLGILLQDDSGSLHLGCREPTELLIRHLQVAEELIQNQLLALKCVETKIAVRFW